jgi:hypothetical protein
MHDSDWAKKVWEKKLSDESVDSNEDKNLFDSSSKVSFNNNKKNHNYNLHL